MAAREGTPGLLPHQRCNKRSYVVGADLVDELGRKGQGLDKLGWFKQYKAELWQWRRVDELPPVALAIAALVHVFHGLRRGVSGCGLQVTVEQLAAVVGCSERMAQYGIRSLVDAGWVLRRRRAAAIEWDCRRCRRCAAARAGLLWRGRPARFHQKAEIHAVLYLTPKAAVRISRRGEVRSDVLRRTGGLVGSLLKTFSQKLRLLAWRVTDAVTNCTPSLKGVSASTSKSSTSSPVGSRPIFGTGPPELVGLALHRTTTAARRVGLRVERVELQRAWRLWRRGQLVHPWQLWPEVATMGPDEGHRRRAWAIRQLERLVEVFSEEIVAGRAGTGR
jgi:hypothetical protein